MNYLNTLRKLFACLILSFIFINSINATGNVSVSATTGAGGPYSTLDSAFIAVNNGVFTGVIAISINGNTVETATPSLNASGVGSASYTALTIKPTVTCTITGSIAGSAIIKLNGADNVTIDGSKTAGGTTQDLTISNTSTSTNNAVVWIAGLPGNGATGNTIKNCIITGNSPATTFTGIMSGGNGGIGVYEPQSTANTNTTIQNNAISNVQWGIDEFGPTTASTPDSGTVITGNRISSLSQLGVYIANQYNLQINNNIISGINYTASHGTMAGINAASTLTGSGTSISGNTITQVKSTGLQSAAVGILISGAWPAGAAINGNTITNIEADSANACGIEFWPLIPSIGAGTISGNNINTIASKAVVNADYVTAGATGIFLAVNQTYTQPTDLTISNNFISNITARGDDTAGTGNLQYNGNGIMIYSGTGYNIYFNSINLAANQIQPGQSAAIYITSSYGPVPNSLNIKDNLLVNTETTGSAYGIYSEVARTAFTNMDYNDYYASTALGYIAGLPSTTVLGMQNTFGGNMHSGNILPNFFSATDLHLTNYNNFCLASGTAIPGITTDIDGDTRNAPDMGADEFTLKFDSASAIAACRGVNAVVTVTDNSGDLASGTYILTYNLLTPNGSTADTVTLNYIAGTASADTFTIPASKLATTGSTTIAFTSISAAASCSAFLTAVPVLITSDSVVVVNDSLISVTLNAIPGTVCNTAGPITLSGSPPGGEYSGAGVNTGVFYPDSVPAGENAVFYIYTNGNGCSNIAYDTVLVEACTGINYLTGNDIGIYPNPVSDVINIYTTGNQTLFAGLTDISGKKLIENIVLDTPLKVLNLSACTAGIYLLEVRDNAGGMRAFKVVKL